MLEYYKFNGVDQYTELETPTSGDFVWEVYGRFLKVNSDIGRSSSHSSVRLRHFGNAWAFSYGYITHAGGTPDFDWHLFQVSIEGLRVDGVLVVPHPEPEPLPANDMPLTLGAMNKFGGAYLHCATEIIATAINGIPLDISSLSGGSPDNYIQTDGGSTKGLDVFRNPLTNLGGYVHNGCEASVVQDPDAWQLLNSIEISFDGVPETLPMNSLDVNGRPEFLLPAGAVLFTGANWILAGAVTSSHPTAKGQYPPKTGWPDTNTGKTFSIEYDMFGIEDDGTRTKLSMADYLAFSNGTQNTLLKWEKAGANNTCHLPQVIRYNQGTTAGWTQAQYDQAVRWAGDPTCGTLPTPNPAPPAGGFSEGFSNGFS